MKPCISQDEFVRRQNLLRARLSKLNGTREIEL